MKSPKGFSLLELLVVILIIGILIGITLLGFAYVEKKQKIQQAIAEMTIIKTGLASYSSNHGNFPNCPEEICTPGECLFLSLLGFHNAGGSLEIPPYQSSLPVGLFDFDMALFDEAEIPDFSHQEGNDLKLWLAEILKRNPALLDPWGNEYQYEFPRKDKGVGYRLFSLGPDGGTGGELSVDDLFPR